MMKLKTVYALTRRDRELIRHALSIMLENGALYGDSRTRRERVKIDNEVHALIRMFVEDGEAP